MRFSAQKLVAVAAAFGCLVTAQDACFAPSAATTKEPAASPPAATGYQPDIPKDYTNCFYDPDTIGVFQLFSWTSPPRPIARKDELAAVRGELEVLNATYYKLANVSPGLFDIQSVNGTAAYLAIYKSGKVGFATRSSNGQDYIQDNGDEYVTTVFSLSCQGEMSAGIIGGDQFEFNMNDDNRIIARLASGTAKRDDLPWYKKIPVIGGEIVRLFGPTPNLDRCPNKPHLIAKQKSPPDFNGCGAAGGPKVPDANWGYCCNAHDICFGTCDEKFRPCNDRFRECMLNQCRIEADERSKSLPPHASMGYDVVGEALKECVRVADDYYFAVSSNKGAAAFIAAADKCECVCPNEGETECDNRCVNTKTDSQNCGTCGHVCPSDQQCRNSACVPKTTKCDKINCGNPTRCGDNPVCACTTTEDGDGYCIEGDWPCGLLPPCEYFGGKCPFGTTCIAGGCCGSKPRCMWTDSCTGGESHDTMKFRRDLFGALAAEWHHMDQDGEYSNVTYAGLPGEAKLAARDF